MAPNLETQKQSTAVEAWKVDYSTKLDEINSKINDLVDDNNENDNQAKIDLANLIDWNFVAWLEDYFKNNPEQLAGFKRTLWETIQKIVDKFKKDNAWKIPEEFNSLINFAEKVWVDLANATESDYTSVNQTDDEAKSGPEKPVDLKFQWQIDGVSEPSDDQKNNRKFYNGIYNKPDNEGEKSQLETFEDKITGEYLLAIDELIASWLDDNQKQNLEEIKKDLNNVLNIMWNPDKANTQKLQDFISANLDESEQEQFKKDNHFREWRFDWDFGIKTLEWLQKVLSKIESYIKSLNDYLKAVDENKNRILDNLKNEEKTFKKWGTPEEFIAYLGLPQWVDAAFASEEEMAKLNSEWVQDISLKVTINGGTQDVIVKVNVTSKSSDAPTESTWEWAEDADSQKPANTEPLTIGEYQYLVMTNSNALASMYKLDWATFYSSNAFKWTKAEWEQAQPQLAENTEMEDWESVYYVKFDGMPNIYKIRVNENWWLFPITTEYSSFVEWVGARALIKNNECCINYLRDKLWNIPWATIQRNNRVNDYTIKSFWEELTIEPMTMDKKWVSKDLWTCLRMLNLTNYLTSWVNEYLKWTDPNLRLRGDNLQVQTVQWWKNISEKTMIDFWLNWVTEWEMRKFIKYNNHEQWEDDWDKKGLNKNYKKLDVSSGAQIIWAGASSQDVKRRAYTGYPSSSFSRRADTSRTQVDGTSGSAEVGWEVLQQSVLIWLLEWIKLNELWTMRSSWHGYQLFEFNNVKAEWANEWGNKYIEIWWHKFMEASENFTGLWYKVDRHWVYIWQFKNWVGNWLWIVTPTTHNLNFPTYIWSFENGVKSWNWKLTLKGELYQWEFKNWLWVWEWKFTWSNWDKFEWTFYNPLWEWGLELHTKNNNGSVERFVKNSNNGNIMKVENFFIGEMKSWTLTLDGKDYTVTDGKYEKDWEVKEISHP